MWVRFLPWAPEKWQTTAIWSDEVAENLSQFRPDRLAGVAGFGCFGRARDQEAVGSKRRHLAIELGGFLR